MENTQGGDLMLATVLGEAGTHLDKKDRFLLYSTISSVQWKPKNVTT